MATFTESQISDLAEILCTNSDVLEDHLSYYAEQITESDKTKVLARVTEWQGLDGDFTRIHPRERNFGAEINPADRKGFLVRSIASLLHWQVSSGVQRLARA
mgnify:CR=1 FL=1